MRSLLVFLLLFSVPVLLRAAEPLPAPWKHQDIGGAQTPGTAEQAAGVFILQGTKDLWGTADGSHIAWRPVHGDFEIIARVAAIENPGGVGHAKGSLSLRESLDAGARHVTVCVTAADGTQFLYRDATNGKTTRIFQDAEAKKASVANAQFPCWLKLIRRGNEFSGFESVDGEKWLPSGQIKLDLAADAIIGLAASSHKPDALTKVTFDHVTLSTATAK